MSLSVAPLRTRVPAIEGGTPAFADRFRFIKPTLPALADVLERYRPVYANGLITNADLVTKLEGEVAERLGVKHCVAVSSCTSGLMMVMRSLELSGEIIMPSFTFFATGHAAVWNSLTPVFADCDPNTWTVRPEDVEAKITPATSAILAVHLYGNPCDVDALTAIARRHGLKLIFDAAHAFGSRYFSKPVGQFGDAEVFSLSPTKLLVAGEGGLVTTNDDILAARVRAARNYGDLGAYDPESIGLNARMSEFNAALALGGLPLKDEKVERHNQIASRYTSQLSGIAGLAFQHVDPHHTCTYKDYSIHVNAKLFGRTRDELAKALLAENIETKKYFYPPLHLQALYRKFHVPQRDRLNATDFVADGILSLPIYESLRDSTVDGIAMAIRSLAK